MVNARFRACLFGSLPRDKRGRTTGPGSPPCRESGYSPSPKAAELRGTSFIDLNNPALLRFSLEERRLPVSVESIWGNYSSQAASCPVKGLFGAGGCNGSGNSFCIASGWPLRLPVEGETNGSYV